MSCIFVGFGLGLSRYKMWFKKNVGIEDLETLNVVGSIEVM
jgi:hypothetical protein